MWMDTVIAVYDRNLRQLHNTMIAGSLKISGRVYHLIGGLQPTAGHSPVWGQIFTLDAVEATNLRMETSRCAAQLRPNVLVQLHSLLRQHNQWISEFAAAGHGDAAELSWSSDDISMRSGIVAVRASYGVRSIVVRKHSANLMHISDRHPLYFPLAYVLLWPAGGIGYSESMTRCDPLSGTTIGKMHMLEWARYLIMRRAEVTILQYGGKLALEFYCDIWSSIECHNLSYLSSCRVQSHFRASRFCTLMDQLRSDTDQNLHKVGAPVLLPAHFTGSPRWYHALYHDVRAIMAVLHAFLTECAKSSFPSSCNHAP